MTLTTVHNRIAYVGDGSTTSFQYTFLITASADLLVYHDDVLQVSGYTVSGVGTGSGGNVTYAVAPADDTEIIYLRATDQTQQVDLIEGDRLPADSVEGMFDKVYALAQDLWERTVRAIKVPATSDGAEDEVDFPDPSDPANQDKVVYINGSGELEARELSTTDTIGNNPIVAQGDLIQGSVSGTPERLAIGAETQILTVVSGKAAWGATAGDLLSNTLIDAKGDLLVGTAADTITRKAVGANNTVLMADSAESDGLRWGLAGVNAIDLTITAATFPDGTDTGNNPPEIVRQVSTGTQTTNTPKATATLAKFSHTVDEHLIWSVFLASNYGSGGQIRLKWKADTGATTGSGQNVVWKAGIVATVDGSTADGTVVFNAADLASASESPASTGQMVEVTIPLTVTNVAANRYARIFIGRDADHASDTMTGDALLVMARFEWS